MFPLPEDHELQSADSIPIKNEESREQARLVAGLRKCWSALEENRRPIVFAIPNGGSRNKIEAMRMKAEGVLAGVHDLCIVRSFGRTIWVEMKSSTGSLSKEQHDIHNDFGALGHISVIAYSAEDALKKLSLLP